MRASWLLGPALAAKSTAAPWERLPPRHSLERTHPEAFIDVDELRMLAGQIDLDAKRRGGSPSSALLPFVCVSHDWETLDHPDPRADRLVSIVSAIELHQRTGADGFPTLPYEMGVYLPWCSLCQEDPCGGRTILERDAFVSALRTMPLWYTNDFSTVLLVHPRPPPSHNSPSGREANQSSSVSASTAPWLAPHPMWGVGGGWSSIERTLLLATGKRGHGGGVRWAQLIETRLGDGGDGLGDAKLSARLFASTQRASAAVYHLRESEGRRTAIDLLQNGRVHLPSSLAATMDTTIGAGRRRIGYVGYEEPTHDEARLLGRTPLAPIDAELIDVHGVHRPYKHEVSPMKARRDTSPKPSTPLPLPILPDERKETAPIPPDEQKETDEKKETDGGGDAVASPAGTIASIASPGAVAPITSPTPSVGLVTSPAALSGPPLSPVEKQVQRYTYGQTLAHRRVDRIMGLDVQTRAVREFFDGIETLNLEHASAGERAVGQHRCKWSDVDLEVLTAMLPFLTRAPANQSHVTLDLGDLPANYGATSGHPTGDENEEKKAVAAKKFGRWWWLMGNWRRMRTPVGDSDDRSESIPRYGGRSSRWPPVPLGYSVLRLQLGANGLGDAGVEALAACAIASGALSSLTVLGLSDNRIRDVGIAALAKALGVPHGFPRLEELVLSLNRIGDAGMLSFADHMRRGVLRHLVTLRLDSNRIGADGARSLARSFGRGAMAGVATLDLSGNKLMDAGVMSLSRIAPKALHRLERLDLSGNALGGRNFDGGGDAGVEAIAAAVAEGCLPALHTLRLNANRVGDEGATALATAIRLRAQAGRRGSALALRELWICENRISADGVGTLATAVSDSAALPALAILGLSGNPGLDGGRAALVSAVGSGPTSVLSLGLDEVIDGRGASTLGAASGAAITSWAAAPGSRRDPRLQYRAEHGSETQPDGFAMDGAMRCERE